VVSLVEGDVLEDTFEEGDTVTEGALLYKIDSSDMEKTLEKANISYEKTEVKMTRRFPKLRFCTFFITGIFPIPP
jgi:HlyD family secretion protein